MVGERRDVRKSKEAIKNAFIQLIINQDIRKITVKDILTLADVSRGTFMRTFWIFTMSRSRLKMT